MTATLEKPTGVPDLIPTHSCFDDVVEFLAMTQIHPRAFPRYRIVHGVCRGHALGTLYAHAWVEQTRDTVWQAAVVRVTGELVFFALPRPDFYELYAVQEQSRYTIPMWLEALELNGYTGPWRAEYKALCNDDPGGPRVVGMMRGTHPIAIAHSGKLYADIEKERDAR